jgi:hypothetical protein
LTHTINSQAAAHNDSRQTPQHPKKVTAELARMAALVLDTALINQGYNLNTKKGRSNQSGQYGFGYYQYAFD